MNKQLEKLNQEYTIQKKSFQFSMPTPQEMDHLIKFCTVMSQSPFYSKLGPGGVMAIYLTAKEHDLPLMACLNGGLHNVDGKVTFSAIMINALIEKAGHKAEILHSDKDYCEILFTRSDKKNDPNYKPLKWKYSLNDAQEAGYLGIQGQNGTWIKKPKDNWIHHTRDMLYCRCLTGGGRKHMSELFVGILVTGELTGTDSDGDQPPLLPSNDESTANHLLISTELVEEKAEYELFCSTHGLLEDTRKGAYLVKLCETTGMTKEQMITRAMKNPESFLSAFEQWNSSNPVAIEVAEEAETTKEV